MSVDFDKPGDPVLTPTKLAHVVLRTNKLRDMIKFYKAFLGARVVFENQDLAFMTYDEEHHRIAFIAIPDLGDKIRHSCGLEHIAFTFSSLSELLLAYRQRKRNGITPVWSVNHGPTTSIYYKDPDGNMLETQVESYNDPEKATSFMRSKEYAQNPIGTDFDPEDHIRKLEAGVSEIELLKREEIGTRGIPDI